MKKFMKMAFAVVAFAAVGLGSYRVYGSYTAANMSEEDLLMAENVLAISQTAGVDYSAYNSSYNSGVSINEWYNRKDYVADERECDIVDSESSETNTTSTTTTSANTGTKNKSIGGTTTTTTTTTTTKSSKATYKGKIVKCATVDPGKGDYAHCSDVPTHPCK